VSRAIAQPESGYRYSLDPFLLAGFAGAEGQCARIADLGCGTGILPLLLAERAASAAIVGIERQPELAELARRNLAASRHAARLQLVEGDLRGIATLLPEHAFDLVCSNPPFRAAGRGRLAANGGRAAARHELHGTLADFVAAAAYLLRPGGRFALVHLPERLTELLLLLQRARIEPKRLRCVHPRAGAAATMVLVEGRAGGRPGLAVEAPLLVRDGADYSAEVRGLYPAELSSLE
jgi:tRNA1Val (adenine37-N6)-methyltransferase